MTVIINNIIVISVFFNFIFCQDIRIDRDYDTDRIPSQIRRRQDSIPMLYVNGSHYEVGIMIGKTFGNVIQTFLDDYAPMVEYLELYQTSDKAKEIYDECLKTVEKYFPQYLMELKGMADGADVSFHELFLLHLNDILTSNLPNTKSSSGTKSLSSGCSTLMVNIPSKGQYIGHNEDAERIRVNGYYIINAHIHPKAAAGGGVFEAREEKWEALTYAGLLPGHASGHNYHGLVYSINSISSDKPFYNKIPRMFLTRALLGTKANITDIQDMLRNPGAGTADAFHVNAGFLEDSKHGRTFYSIEVTPSKTQALSNVMIQLLKSGSMSFYTSKLQYTDDNGLKNSNWCSSSGLRKTFSESTFSKPIESIDDLLKVLGGGKDGDWQIFKDSDDDPTNTLNIGVFDFIEKTWSIWTNNPQTTSAILKLPLKFTIFISPTPEDQTVEKRPYYNKFSIDYVSDMYALGKKTLVDLVMN